MLCGEDEGGVFYGGANFAFAHAPSKPWDERVERYPRVLMMHELYLGFECAFR
jgi:hypothetical protein